jgi:hypothetical protein
MKSKTSGASGPVSIGTNVVSTDQIEVTVENVLATTQFIDMHTHLFPPSFGKLNLWGIDELLTYHYLEAEFFRSSDCSYDHYWSLSKKERADAIWQTLFVENNPISEATRGVIAVLNAFDLPTESPDLTDARAFFQGQAFDAQTVEAHVKKVFQMAGISCVVMTNDPLDVDEAPLWIDKAPSNLQFHGVLRLNRILRGWIENWQLLSAQGYDVDASVGNKAIAEVRRFLSDWCARISPMYMAVSLPYSFQFPDDSLCSKLLSEAVLPSCRELGLPLSLMIGVRYQANPKLRLAGDAVGRIDLAALENLCRDFADNRFLVSILSRENQHELCVYARKFNNLMPFGCWWFLNNPSIVEEITRERIELLGASFIPQHSDARILEQVIYKWRNTRRTLTPILAQSYRLLSEDGRKVTRQDIEQDIHRLFCGNFEYWTKQRTIRLVAAPGDH